MLPKGKLNNKNVQLKQLAVRLSKSSVQVYALP